MTADYPSDSARAAELFTKATNALLDLFDTPETMLISNQSMRVLLDGFASTLEQAFRNGTEDKLFERWEGQLPQARARLLAEANREPFSLINQKKLPTLSEDKAGNFLRMCPRAPEPF